MRTGIQNYERLPNRNLKLKEGSPLVPSLKEGKPTTREPKDKSKREEKAKRKRLETALPEPKLNARVLNGISGI